MGADMEACHDEEVDDRGRGVDRHARGCGRVRWQFRRIEPQRWRSAAVHELVELGSRKRLGLAEILLQNPDLELTSEEVALLRAGIYCGIAAAFDQLGIGR